jgi:hypothetical protein
MIITRRFFSVRSFLVLALALILSVATYGFAANNTVGDSSAGDGTGTVSGYTVTVVSYQLNATNPSEIDGVTVSIPVSGTQVAPKTVAVQFQDASTASPTPLGGWYSCTAATATYNCTASGAKATVKPTAQLRVVAAQ